MRQNLTTKAISEALFSADPMHTCCVENDCFDEYDGVAERITTRLTQGVELDAAIRAELAYSFDEGLADAANIEPVLSTLRKEVGVHDR